MSIDELAIKINNGEVGVMPTDTVYGLVAQAKNEQAVKRLYSLKNREGKPGTIIASSTKQLVDLGLKKRYLTAVESYWPGAVSVVIPTGEVLKYLHQGKQSLAVRIPKDKALTKLLAKTGALLSSSANLPGEKPATTLQEAKAYFSDKLDFYVDGGRLEGKPSTVIRVVDDVVEVLREGRVKINEAGVVLNDTK